MANIQEEILADAQARKPDYKDRMQIFELPLEDFPAGLAQYSIKIKGLYDYLPISYFVYNNGFYTSLQQGDFARLLQRLKLLEDKTLSATNVAKLFLFLEYPSRERLLVENLEDMALM